MKLEIRTHEGDTHEVEVDSYDSQETNTLLNSHEINTVVFGDVILSRINVKFIKPIVTNDQIEENI
ncbi:hypothetical protein BhaS171_00025 [Bacillus phage vB_BhaS-171]|uniref:hypothetical protein n=1 Tax=Bacillus phage vB_BhaS-171 TaxID=1775140 RepID=UPI000744C100|nr:hypothetical protein BH781_gp25 [Bacillus phage vB_BhaS-171]ALY08081.1 hypothetical protein BhaS171_00025 [Bacillus phage vB_BhaS-171]